MQRLVYLYTGTSRLIQVVGINHLKYSKLLSDKSNVFSNSNILTVKRYLATKNKNTDGVDTHSDLYKPSTAKKATPVSNELHSGQSPETFDTGTENSITAGGKVWSAQNPGSVHVASLNQVQSTKFVSEATEGELDAHEKKVYTAQGKLNTAGSFKTLAEATPVELAEAAAASAFEPFAPDTSSKSASTSEAVFAPKISSKDVYSTTSSPTSNFDTAVPTSSQQDPVKYETAHKQKVFGGQDTSADSKKRSKDNPFDLKEQNKPSDIRNEILRQSLKYVREKGWSIEAIRAGIHACHQPTTAEKLFYNGYDLVDYFMRDANAKMIDHMNELAAKEHMEGTRLLIDGLKYRLKLVIPYADTWEQALAQKGLPHNAKRAWESLLDLANDAWINIGDKATDIKWYTKRLSVATIYRTAEIYMLQDQSIDKIETMNFLERHLGDFQTTGCVRPSVSQSLSDTAQVASGLFTVVRTMTIRR